MSRFLYFAGLCLILFSLQSVRADVWGRLSFDFENVIPVLSFQCLSGQNITFVRLEAWYQTLVPTLGPNAANAAAGGFPGVGLQIYLTPTFQGNEPASLVVKTLKDYVTDQSIHYSALWIGVLSGSPSQWYDDATKNQQYMVEFVKACNDAGVKWGVFTRNDFWEDVFGSEQWTDPILNGSNLCYLGYDANPNYNDFVQFGAWNSPHIKFFWNDEQTDCSTTSGKFWHP